MTLYKLGKFMISKKGAPILITILSIGILGALSCKGKGTPTDTLGRQQQLMVALAQIMERYHYSPRNIDDSFSTAVFNGYLKQLDPDKDIFLDADIQSLSGYKTKIDDELHDAAPMEFFPKTLELFMKRIHEVNNLYQTELSKPFTFTEKGVIPNADSIGYPNADAERKSRWYAHIKYEVLSRYVDLLNQKKKALELSKKPKSKSDTSKTKIDSIIYKSDAQLEKEARESIRKKYDRSFKRFFKTNSEEEQYDSYINVICNLMDPHTEYQAPLDKREFDESMSNSFYGIGAQLGIEDGNVKIVSVIPGMAAWKSKKIEKNDQIIKVGQGQNGTLVDITGYEITDAIKLIRGNENSYVRLVLKKALDGSLEEVTLKREKVNIDEASARSAVVVKNGKKLGYIYLPEFYDNFNDPNGAKCADDMAVEINKLKKENIQGLVIDLRNNGGGSLYDVIQIIGMFIDKGPVVQVRDRDGKSQELNDTKDGILYSGPLTVMINGMSASASEIFAAAIQDYHRGVIIGTDSYGKGTVQKQIPLGNMKDGQPEYGAIKLTFEKFYRINGGSTQRKGVVPDVWVPDLINYLPGLREKDSPSALPWDKIAASSYTVWPIDYHIAEIAAKQNAEIKSDLKFQTIDKNAKLIAQKTPYYLDITDFEIYQEMMKNTLNKEDSIIKLKTLMNISPIPIDVNKYFHNKDQEKANRYKQWFQDLKKDIYINEAVNTVEKMLPYSK